MAGKRPGNYHTRQGESILEYMKSLGDRHVTVSQIARHFAEGAEAVGQTTVYRHLEKLAAGGVIRKYVLSGGASACYQYINDEKHCREHFHLKCENCGSLIHADCDFLDDMAGHLLKRHHFEVDMLKTVFYGTCKNCRTGRGV
jgi:Fur family ferric uptake transcriptional regulator